MIKAIIFDLDGVIVSTDEYHFRAWRELARFLNLPFSRQDNTRQRGVSRMESLEVILKKSDYSYDEEEKQYLADKKNTLYQKLLTELSSDEILPGACEFAEAARAAGLKLAVGSSSRNTPFILKKIGLDTYFDAVADGNDIERSKPDPQVFQIAAERVDRAPAECLVIEDAAAGVEAAIAGGMYALAVGEAAGHTKAHYSATGLAEINLENLLATINRLDG